MNIKTVAKQWLLDHGFDESSSSFEDDVKSLGNTICSVLDHQGYVYYDDAAMEYDSKFGDDKICTCGHVYYRHFDTYEGMAPVGCKYCYCDCFKEI